MIPKLHVWSDNRLFIFKNMTSSKVADIGAAEMMPDAKEQRATIFDLSSQYIFTISSSKKKNPSLEERLKCFFLFSASSI